MTRAALVSLLLLSGIARAQYGRPAILRGIGIDQHMGAQVPLDVALTDESGASVTLARFTGRPIVLALVYYRCPSLCNMVLSGVVRGTRTLALRAGRDFDVVAISFDPRDTPEIARAKRATYLNEYKHPGAESGWHFLTASESAARAIADSAGFHYAWDQASNQFVHPSAVMILTPQGRVSRYLYGIDYPSRDMKLSLIEASGGTIGAPTDRILLFCFHYDPANGRYSLMIMNILRATCIALLAALAIFMIVMFRRDARNAHILREHHP